MARKTSGTETRKRDVLMQTRLSQAEATTIRLNADRAGLSVAAYLRSAALGMEPPRATRRPTVNHKSVALILGQLGRVAQSFREAAEAADQRQCHALIDAATRDLAEMRSVCFEALGREP